MLLAQLLLALLLLTLLLLALLLLALLLLALLLLALLLLALLLLALLLLALLLLTLPGVWWLLALPQLSWLPLLAVGLGVLALLGLAVLQRLRPGLLARWAWLRQARDCLTTRPLSWLLLTLLAWAAQGLAVWLICRELGLTIDPLLATGFYALAMVGGAWSMLPAGLGGMEALLTGLLLAFGAELGLAAGITVLVRLLTLWLAVAIGVVALLYSAAFRKDLSLR